MNMIKYLPFLLSVMSLELAAQSLCLEQETDEFSCKLKTKLVSICSTDNLQIYRFGQPSNVELELTASAAIEHYGFSGGGERVMTFNNGQYSYVVNSRTVRTEYVVGGWDVETSADLTVSRNDEIVASWECSEILTR
ncbi:hypothetical protein AKJ18_07885 [Vibrio xuii]|nr:hypothetical protein AKJ18_07885 [Vibrio xuii]